MSIKSEKENYNNNVYCRFRPMTKEESEFSSEQISPLTSSTILNINTIKEKNLFSFNFDYIFPPNSSQQDIYEKCTKNYVETFLLGYNSAIITHGQNNSGKSYTMIGKIYDDDLKGIIPRAVKDIFEYIFDNENLEFIVKVSMIAIYEDKIRDLINNNDINFIIDDNFMKNEINFEGIYEEYISNEKEALNLLEKGINNKTKLDYTINLNGKFNKSNFLFLLKLIQNDKKEGYFKKSELIFFDSAGEENIFLEPDPNIQSLIPIIFKKIFEGNYKTNLIITCSLSIFNQEKTLKYLRFGEKMKKIKNKAIINKEFSYEKLKEQLNNYESKIKHFEELNVLKSNKNRYINDENLCFEEIFNLIVDLIEKEKNIENKDNILGKINNLKEIYNTDIENLNKKIKVHEESIKINNEIKYRLQKTLIEQQTQNMENKNLFNDFKKYISELKKYKEINLKQIEEFDIKLSGFDTKNNLDKNINQFITNDIKEFNDLILEKNIEILYDKENKNNTSEKFSQTEINQRKISQFELDNENDIKYLSQCLEENKEIILELKEEILTLQNKNKILENNALLNERKIREKNMILENNILELKKKYEESQVKRLILEDKIRKLNNIFFNKKVNFIDIKDESINKSISTPKNIVQISTRKEEDKI